MATEKAPRICKNPGCNNPVPPRKPGHRSKLACCDNCRKAASRAHLREEARHREEEARQQRRTRWQTFQPQTLCCLEQVEAFGGPALAEQVAEAIRIEREHSSGTADLAMEPVTAGVPTPFVGH